MPAPKGSKNAKAYQEKIVQQNRKLIEGELHNLKNVRAKFDSMTALSQALSKATGVSDVTIRRNPQYRSLLVTHMSEMRARSVRQSPVEAELSKLQHRIMDLELQLSNAIADNNRLRRFSKAEIIRLETVRDTKHELASGCDDIDWEQSCLKAFFLIKVLLSRAFFEVDFNNCTIFDRTGIGDEEIIAGSNISEPYVDWLKKTGGRGSL